MAGIIGDRHALRSAALLDDVVGQPLGSAADHIDVHPVDACADDAPKACRAKLQIHVEALFDLVLILCDGTQLCFGLLVKIGVGQPFIVDLHVIFHLSLLLLLFLPYLRSRQPSCRDDLSPVSSRLARAWVMSVDIIA